MYQTSGLRKIKFICITMTFVTIMLFAILGLVMFFTTKNLEINNIQMMKGIANNPMLLNSPSVPPKHVRLPYFCLHFDHKGNLKTHLAVTMIYLMKILLMTY